MAQQENKLFLEVKTPEGSFSLSQFRGIERLSAPFEYTLLMTSTTRDINFNALMGQSATVSLTVGSETRTFQGIIGHFEQDDTPFTPLNFQTNYRAILYPKLWLLNFSGQCRIFQNKSALDIIKSVLDEHEVPYSNQVTSAGMSPLEYCVQYNETDFAFISRLMEKEGIFYFFQQNQTSHMLVLADSPTAHAPCPSAVTASFHDAAAQDQFLLKVSSCLVTQRIVPKDTVLKSYNYLTPQTPLKAPATGQPYAGGGTITRYEQIYQQQNQGDTLAKTSLQALEYPYKMVRGLSTVPFFLAGYKFTLKDHPREDANLDYVLYEVIHEIRLNPEGRKEHLYENTYTAFPSTVPFKAPQITPKPHIFGTQTAKVTGKEGEEIYTEEYGRIKVKFHWDPSEKEDESTSCWIRVATLWSGTNWGTLFTPRVGQEVVVSFIDGDPDKPLIVGSVYNGDHKPPYLPSEPTKSTIKSQSSKVPEGEEVGYNEFRFEDKQGSEQIYLHAQKDLEFYIQDNWKTTLSDGSRTTTLEAKKETQGNDSLTLVKGDKSLKIQKGNLSTELLDGNKNITLTKGNNSLKILKGDYSIELLEGNNSATLTKGNYSLTLTEGHVSVTCLSGGITFNVTGGNISLQTPETVSVKAGQANINAEAVTVDSGTATITAGDISVITTTATINAGVASIEGGELNISSGAVTIESGAITAESGVISLSAGEIALNGLVTIDGLIPVVIPAG
jgi:type VI secretion system secreted protein VgrG